MKKKIRILGTKVIPVWLLVLALVVTGAGAAAGTILVGKVTGEVPVAVSQALLVGQPVAANSLATLRSVVDGSASWSTDQAHKGSYSAKLGAGTIVDVSGAKVTISLPALDIDNASVSDPTVYAKAATAHGKVPYFNILLDTNHDGVVDDALEGLTSAGTISTTVWTLIQEAIGYYDFDMSLSKTSSAFETKTLAEWKAALSNIDVVGVQVVFGYCGWNAGQVVYIDDVTINGVSCPLDMGDLGGIDTVPQGTQRHYDTPNRYSGSVADDNTAFQFASEVATGDMYLIALPLKNASNNNLVAELTLNVPGCMEVEVMSASDVHGGGNVTNAIRIGLNTWKFKVLGTAEYNWLTDNLYIAVSLDDGCAPGYYTINGTIKQIGY